MDEAKEMVCEEKGPITDELLRKMNAYWRAANYLSAGQLYLLENPLLKKPLTFEMVKKKIVGHWGTVPGQNFVYLHLNRVIKRYDLDMILLSGPIDAGDVQTLASRVVAALSQPFILTQGIANIGVSVGIARAETDERKELVARADFALYDAKESGRNTFRMFDDVKKAA